MNNIDSMMMDEIVTMGSNNKDHHLHHHQSMIMKGKRTKRPRQPSPASAVFTASSCSSGGDGGGGKMHTKIRSSESLCSEIISSSTEEDQDMANCLILLAQSGSQNIMSTTITTSNNTQKQEGGEKIIISSKKFKEMTTSSTTTIIGGKAGIFVYECKTCNRSFPSFQALGGHRTSHKKLKPTLEIEEKKGQKGPSLDDHHNQENKQDEEKGKKFIKINPTSLLSLEIPKKTPHHHDASVVINGNISKVKVHECSICGAEFSSGQALGGHMRRHRIPITTNTTTPATVSSHDDGEERPRNILELDLNLPAPLEDDLHDSQFQLSLFSSPSLVDCKY